MLTAQSVAYARESLSPTLWDELVPLLAAHYDEVAHFRDIPLDPDRSMYERVETNGGLRIYTARLATGSLIGYMVVFIAQSMHYRSKKFANQDILFVDRPYRGSRIGIDLIRFAHTRLRSDDQVDVVFQHTKHKSDLNIGPMLGRLLGYEHVDDIWAKRLDGG